MGVKVKVNVKVMAVILSLLYLVISLVQSLPGAHMVTRRAQSYSKNNSKNILSNNNLLANTVQQCDDEHSSSIISMKERTEGKDLKEGKEEEVEVDVDLVNLSDNKASAHLKLKEMSYSSDEQEHDTRSEEEQESDQATKDKEKDKNDQDQDQDQEPTKNIKKLHEFISKSDNITQIACFGNKKSLENFCKHVTKENYTERGDIIYRETVWEPTISEERNLLNLWKTGHLMTQSKSFMEGM